jgi:predicted RNase H-like HicB family nuclease
MTCSRGSDVLNDRYSHGEHGDGWLRALLRILGAARPGHEDPMKRLLTCSLSAIYVASPQGVAAYIPELPGVHAQGATINDARASLNDALQLILAANRAHSHESFRSAHVLLREPVLAPVAGH